MDLGEEIREGDIIPAKEPVSVPEQEPEEVEVDVDLSEPEEVPA